MTGCSKRKVLLQIKSKQCQIHQIKSLSNTNLKIYKKNNKKHTQNKNKKINKNKKQKYAGYNTQ
jgi:hypothetical protein